MEPGVAQPISELEQLKVELKALKDKATGWEQEAAQTPLFTEKKTYLDFLTTVNQRIVALEARLTSINDAGESG